MAYFTGYSVYYLSKNGTWIGYCLVQSGKDMRYKFATDKDIIVGPYYISKEYRGRKLSIELLNYVLKHSGLQYVNAFDYIAKDNIPSIKASLDGGFKYMSDAKISKYTRMLRPCDDCEGDYMVLKFENRI